jgi:lipopolysaccharide cholinephosphotransferase
MTQSSIQTSSGAYVFAPVELFHGRSKIDKAIAADNLIALKDVFDRVDLRFGLIYGTLLGVIREKDFISWDEDVDVFVLDEDRNKLHDAFWLLRGVGLEVVRREGDLYSVMGRNNYIDIYVFRSVGSKRWCNSDVMEERFLRFQDRVEFLGVEFYTAATPFEFLATMYGEDWRIPKQDYPARPWSAWRKLKRLIRDAFPVVLTIRRSLFGKKSRC